MKLVDANVLLYAVDERAKHHGVSKQWLDAALSGRDTVLFPWISLLAFVRIATSQGVFERPLDIGEALSVVESWMGQPTAIVPVPDSAHPRRMRILLEATGRGGNLVNDAHLAALAIQYGAIVVTFDSDFGRFPELRWEMPRQFPNGT